LSNIYLVLSQVKSLGGSTENRLKVSVGKTLKVNH